MLSHGLLFPPLEKYPEGVSLPPPPRAIRLLPEHPPEVLGRFVFAQGEETGRCPPHAALFGVWAEGLQRENVCSSTHFFQIFQQAHKFSGISNPKRFWTLRIGFFAIMEERLGFFVESWSLGWVWDTPVSEKNPCLRVEVACHVQAEFLGDPPPAAWAGTPRHPGMPGGGGMDLGALEHVQR